jgi:outer membrane immunogenic protein
MQLGERMMRQFVVSTVVLSAFAASSAFAADLPIRNAPPVVKAPSPMVAVVNWSGFYVGGHIGYGWAETEITDFALQTATQKFNSEGFLGGVQAGWNDQFGRAVLGVELDFSFADIKGDRTATSASSNTTWIATATTRLGYTWDCFMIYGKLGTAWAQFDYDNISQGGSSETRTGWTIGAGIEWTLAGPWTAKAEYNYIDLFAPLGGGVSSNLDIDQRISVVKVGLNYRFGTPHGYGGPPYGYGGPPPYSYGAPPRYGYGAPPYGYGGPRY